MTPPVFVFDTNVVVAGLITRSSLSPVVRALDGMFSGSFVYLLSPALLDEYRAVLLRPRLRGLHGLDERAIDQLLVELTANAIWRETEEARVAPDRGDEHLWALLSAFPGSILVTGDRLLMEQPLAGSSVISPRTFVDRFFRDE